MNNKRKLIVQLNYFDTLLEKWKQKKPLTINEEKHLKEILQGSHICKKCGEIDNQIRENKIQYVQQKTKNINYVLKWLILVSGLLLFYNFIFALSTIISLIMTFSYIKHFGVITKCLNCGSNDSFVEIKRYMKKPFFSIKC